MPPVLYNPLSATEIKSLVLQLIDRELTNSGKFDEHVTYPLVKFSFSLTVELPVMVDRNFYVDSTAAIKNNPPNESLYEGELESFQVHGEVIESEEMPADRIRDENQMPVTETIIGKGHAGLPTIEQRQVVRGPRISREAREQKNR